ncbi:MAG TPA: BON domain-containing protein [Chloroflexota bacterium]|nr:BON domain-containing protein [Chloroflexota bacterium]
MAIAIRTDAAITADVLAELTWDPAVTIADLEITTADGYVTLSGTTATYSSRDAAEDAAYRVLGVRGVTNNIVVDPASLGVRADADIQADVRTALTLDTLVPLDRLGVSVYNGMVTLTGNLDFYYQRMAAEDDAGQIAGVLGITDLITVTPTIAIAVDVSDSITQAFARNAELADDNVSVMVDGTMVTLGGTVSTWSEYDEAAAAAWRAPGVGQVVNNIFVTY